MELAGNSNSATSADFLRQLRVRHYEPLTVIWDNSPAHRGDALRAYLTTPGLNLCLVKLPSYSPDFNADEAVWGWVRQDVTANSCRTHTAKLQMAGAGLLTLLREMVLPGNAAQYYPLHRIILPLRQALQLRSYSILSAIIPGRG